MRELPGYPTQQTCRTPSGRCRAPQCHPRARSSLHSGTETSHTPCCEYQRLDDGGQPVPPHYPPLLGLGSSAYYLEAVVGPAAELHDTGLLVEGEVLHVHLAGAVVDGGGLPLHESLAVESGLGGQSNLEVAVSTSVKIARSGVETDWDFADKSADFSNPN